MKTKLLKLALCAMAMLPIGAWADIDFGTERTVSTKTLWTFDDVSVLNGITEYKNAYIRDNRAAETSNFEIKNDYTGGALTFSNGMSSGGFTKYLKTTANTDTPNATRTAGQNADRQIPTFALNAEVAGTVYAFVKPTDAVNSVRVFFNNGSTVTSISRNLAASTLVQISYSSKEKGTFLIGGAGSTFELYAVLFVPASEEHQVTSATEWVFDDVAGTSYDQNAYVGNNGYIHANAGNTMTVATANGNKQWADATTATWTKYLASSKAMANRDNYSAWATGASEGTFTASFGFYAAVHGTCYALMSSDVDGKKLRVHHANGTSVINGEVTATNKDEIYEVSKEVDRPGAFFVGGVESGYKIYAVRFVPKTEEVTIGTTGYATYSNNNTCALSLPYGLTAYRARAGDDGQSVKLTKVSQMRPTSGYVLKGTSGATYTLTAVVDNGNSSDGPGEMKRAATYSSKNIPATDGDKYNYILGADGTTAKFFEPDGNSKLALTKAFLQTKTALSATSARGFDLIIEDETTGIMQVTRTKYGSEEYYNLNGQRVAQPTKGLYIVNGKKVILK